MKRNVFYIILTVTFQLSACGANAVQPQPTAAAGTLQSIPVIDNSIATQSPLPTATQTTQPIATLTATITPLPTIPTFTPTFDARTIVTVTPASPVECPKEDPTLVPDFPYCDKMGCSGGPYHEATQNYLNAGGSLSKLEKKSWGIIRDLTGDQLKELVFTEWDSSYIYGCRGGKYELLSEFKGTQRTPSVDKIIDLNGDKIPELIFINAERHAYLSIHILEWNGKEFISLINNRIGDTTYDWIGGTAFQYKISDMNRDGLKEIIGIDNDLFTYENLFGLPLRKITTVLSWNGSNFVVSSEESSTPEYRFQAIQDADQLVLYGYYNKALHLYNDAISSKSLGWWSKERQPYESYNAFNTYMENRYLSYPAITATPTAYPTMPPIIPDDTEYPKLAAYAYYRIMLIHTVRGYESDAGTVYNTLQQKFGADPNGRPYVEMATAFWDVYQTTHKMYDGCAAAIHYADEHPEILIPLGSDYHGNQSHIYVPEDVCPFR